MTFRAKRTRLSNVFTWRGVVRYWDADPKKSAPMPPTRAPRRPAINISVEAYEKIVRLARERGISFVDMLDEVLRDV